MSFTNYLIMTLLLGFSCYAHNSNKLKHNNEALEIKEETSMEGIDVKRFEEQEEIKLKLKSYKDIDRYLKENLFLGHEGGNGGDPTRLAFLETAKHILENKAETLIRIIGEEKLILIIDRLSIANVKLSKHTLVDNGGSFVSAIYENGQLLLYIGSEIEALSWDNLLEGDIHNINKLVLHELLRLAEVNDDNYIISSQIFRKNKYTIIDQTLILPDWLLPYSSSSLELLGEEIKTLNLGCINIKYYRLDKLLNLSCDEKSYRCRAKEIGSNTETLSLKLDKVTENKNLLKSINEIKSKAVLSCTYSNQLNYCNDSFKRKDLAKKCKLVLIDRLLPNGQVLSGDSTF